MHNSSPQSKARFIRSALCILHVALLFLPQILPAQTDIDRRSHFLKDTSQNAIIRLSSNYYFASNAVTDRFATDYALNRYINDGAKDDVTKKLKALNRVGIEAGGEISAIFRPDTNARSIQTFVALRQRMFVASEFPEDFFEIYFRGNKNYAGKTAEFTDLKIHYLLYRQAAFGIGREYNMAGNNKLRIAADVGINLGQKFLYVNTGQTTIYTHDEGEYLDAVLHATVHRDDSATTRSDIDGFGASGDFYIEYGNENRWLTVSVENAGAIRWSKWSSEVVVDTAIRFEGLDVSYLFDFKDSVRSTTTIDSSLYYHYINHRSTGKANTQLPVKISAAYSRYYMPGNRLLLTAGMDVLLNTFAVPRGYAAADYKLHKTNHVGLLVAYGGFTGFHSGISYVHLFPKKFRLEAGSAYIFPTVDYKHGTSQGAYLIISKGF